jgi:hypothetical protein
MQFHCNFIGVKSIKEKHLKKLTGSASYAILGIGWGLVLFLNKFLNRFRRKTLSSQPNAVPLTQAQANASLSAKLQADLAKLREADSELLAVEQDIQGDIMVLAGVIVGASVTLTATPVDSNGNPVTLPVGAKPPVWMSSDTTLLTLAPSADGLSAVATGVAPGSPTVSVASPDLPNSPSGSASEPVSATAPPPPPTVFGFVITQA